MKTKISVTAGIIFTILSIIGIAYTVVTSITELDFIPATDQDFVKEINKLEIRNIEDLKVYVDDILDNCFFNYEQGSFKLCGENENFKIIITHIQGDFQESSRTSERKVFYYK